MNQAWPGAQVTSEGAHAPTRPTEGQPYRSHRHSGNHWVLQTSACLPGLKLGNLDKMGKFPEKRSFKTNSK